MAKQEFVVPGKQISQRQMIALLATHPLPKKHPSVSEGIRLCGVPLK
jgi:hypothetical protein